MLFTPEIGSTVFVRHCQYIAGAASENQNKEKLEATHV